MFHNIKVVIIITSTLLCPSPSEFLLLIAKLGCLLATHGWCRWYILLLLTELLLLPELLLRLAKLWLLLLWLHELLLLTKLHHLASILLLHWLPLRMLLILHRLQIRLGGRPL